MSSALDVVTYYIIRRVGAKIPKALFPFISGLFTTTCVIIYCSQTAPIDWLYLFRSSSDDGVTSDADSAYTMAIVFALIGSVIGWMALEFMVIGLGISKSALASYGEMTGVVVPVTFDCLFFGRELLTTDIIGITLISCL